MKQFNIKLKYKILFSPFIFIWNTFLIYGGLLLPTTLLIGFSLISLLSYPIKTYLNNNCGGDLEIDDALFDDYGNPIGYFLGVTILIWGPFYFTYRFIKDGSIIIME